MLKKKIDYIKNNHLAMMAICCILPILLIFGLQLLGFNSVWLYPLALVACIGSHVAMMFFGSKNEKGEKSCH